MSPCDITTTVGCVSVLKNEIGPIIAKRAEGDRYTAAVTDIAVINKNIPNLYHVSDIFKDLRQNLCVVFAPWHMVKYTCNMVWRNYMHTIIAPVYFVLFPERSETFVSYADLQGQVGFLMQMQMAYMGVRDDFLKYFASNDSKARDLFIQFFEFALPLVGALFPLQNQCLNT